MLFRVVVADIRGYSSLCVITFEYVYLTLPYRKRHFGMTVWLANWIGIWIGETSVFNNVSVWDTTYQHVKLTYVVYRFPPPTLLHSITFSSVSYSVGDKHLSSWFDLQTDNKWWYTTVGSRSPLPGGFPNNKESLPKDILWIVVAKCHM